MFAIHPSTLGVLHESVRADIDGQARLRQITGRGRRLTAQAGTSVDFSFATLVALIVGLLAMVLIG